MTTFTDKQFSKAISFLENKECYDPFCEFEIPTSWHKKKMIPCSDAFVFHTTHAAVIEYDDKLLAKDDDMDASDIAHDMIRTVFPNHLTCGGYAKFVYELKVHVDRLEEEKNIVWAKGAKQRAIERAEQEKSDAAFTAYINALSPEEREAKRCKTPPQKKRKITPFQEWTEAFAAYTDSMCPEEREIQRKKNIVLLQEWIEQGDERMNN